jgi:uncharacterized protein (TIGR01777 family)
MKIILTGGTGLIGDRVSQYLARQEYEIIALTRRAGQKSPHGLNLRFVQWDARSLGAWAQEVDGADAIVHLAGEGIFDARWTADVKRRIVESRINSTRILVQAIAQAQQPPSLFVSTSAVGFYGDRKNESTDETAPAGTGFLADVCVQWEAEAQKAAQYGVRVANPRIGIVLDKNGGALGRMKPIFQAFLGMPLGSGKQWFPWVHVEDVVRGLVYPLENIRLEGAYNLASPNPATMTEFCAALGEALHRPSWSLVGVPEFALRLGLGEAADSLIRGQKIIPRKLMESGFVFRFPTLAPALEEIFR